MTLEMRLNCTGSWTDYTDDAVVSSLIRDISLDEQNDPRKSSTSSIELSGAAYTLVKTNLIDSANRYSNSICVRITDTECGGDQYVYKIDSNDIRWCDNNQCKIDVDLIEYSPEIDCIRKTVISDNTNGDYQQYPTSTAYPHPRFRYCDVMKPTFMFGVLVTFINSVDLFILSLNFVLNTTINPLITAVNSLLGLSLTTISIPYLGVTALGCDRGFPAPFVRTYIDNVCDICGLTVDDTTDPIFHVTIDDGNVYYNTALLTAYSTKGVKMTGNMGYLPSNRPSWTLTKFLSVLKGPFNARWFYNSATSTIHFDRRDRIGDNVWGASVVGIDLTGDDYDHLIGDVCYSWNGKGKPYRIYLKYGTDASDNIGNELLKRFNGEFFDTSSPNYTEAIEDQFLEFGAASFVRDGNDSLWDANLVNSVTGVFSGTLFDDCLKTQGDTCALAKLIIWDEGSPMDDARAIQNDYTIYTGIKAFEDDDSSDPSGMVVTPADCAYYNWPMSFDPEASAVNANLWGNFHIINSPNNSGKTNIKFELTLEYCCPYNSLNIYKRVLMADGVTYGEIDKLIFDHNNRTIKVSGNLID